MNETFQPPPRANVLGVGISVLDPAGAVRALEAALASGRRGYVCVTGVHGVMEAQDDPAFRRILNRSLLTTPDGMPTVWVGRAQGHRALRRVYGPDLMRDVMHAGAARGRTHFLCGGGPGVAEDLERVLRAELPDLRVVGCYTPPFGPLAPADEAELTRRVAAARPDYLWVGLSTPKQERFMAAWVDRLDARILLGVGAAFDIRRGARRDAPGWVKAAGLQWLHRLLQEPRRLWRRYLINNPRFLGLIALQLLGLRRYPLEDGPGGA